MRHVHAATFFVACFASGAFAQEPSDFPPVTLFKNVLVFNGVDGDLRDQDVLVVGGKIQTVAEEIPETGTYELDVDTGFYREVVPPVGADFTGGYTVLRENAQGETETIQAPVMVIDGGGLTLMPGFIEAHGHIGLPVPLDQITEQVDWQYLGVGAAVNAELYLMNGWTTVRDAGGPVYGIKKAIDEGRVPGPRIYPSGKFVSQTSGHGDVRAGYASPHPNDLSVEPWANREFFALADGVPEVLRATREELRKGAVHIKLMAGGGISSQYDPIHTNQYLFDEMKAAVDAAADWGTYVMVHAYTDASVRRAIEAGVKVIEHGQLMTDETAQLAAENDVWLSTQIAFLGEPPTPEQIAVFGKVVAAKFNMVRMGVETSIDFAKQYGIKVAFGTDLWGPRLPEINNEFEYRSRYFTNLETLQQATSINGELLRLTGPLNPYPDGPIGVIEEGAYADILLVDGDPLEDVTVLVDPSNVTLVMKDGVIHKNTMGQ